MQVCNIKRSFNLPNVTVPVMNFAPIRTSNNVSSTQNNIGLQWSDVTTNDWVVSTSVGNYSNLRIGDTAGNAQGATVVTSASGTDRGYLNTVAPRNLIASLSEATNPNIKAIIKY